VPFSFGVRKKYEKAGIFLVFHASGENHSIGGVLDSARSTADHTFAPGPILTTPDNADGSITSSTGQFVDRPYRIL
jgi:hypothetical protein